MSDDTQLTRDDMKRMTPDEIATAYDAGRFDVALGGRTDDEADLIARAATEDVTATEVRALAAIGRHDLINDAHRDGRITFTNTYDTKEN